MRERFGHYTLLRRLAVGGMAEIFVAQHANAAAHAPCVVIKRILPHLSEDPSFVRMFIDEARLAVGLVHPNIVRTFDFGCVGALHYLTMAQVAGIDLARLLGHRLQHKGALDVAASVALGLGLARGLHHAHSFVSADGTAQHVIHRDVSPQNVMVGHDGVPVLMDFGIAKAALRISHTLTGSGTIKGKLAYMAPEQVRGEPATQQSDQYALGVMLWECMAGRRLFANAPARRLGRSADPGWVPPLGDVMPEVPAPVANIVMRALAPAAEQRYPHVQAMHAALHRFVSACPGGEPAAQAALARLAQDVAADGQHGDGDWSWQRGPNTPGKTVALAAPPPKRKRRRHAGQATCAARAPAARALIAPGRPRPKLARTAPMVRLCWALYAAACGAVGHALWPQNWSRLTQWGCAASVISRCVP